MSTSTTDRILYALYCLSRDCAAIDASQLGRAAGTSASAAAAALIALEHAGLADASRARLTLLGLARAAQLTAAAGGGGAQPPSVGEPRREPLPPTSKPIAAGSVAAVVSRRAREPAVIRWLRPRSGATGSSGSRSDSYTPH